MERNCDTGSGNNKATATGKIIIIRQEIIGEI
jgi:hypothetical protein